MPGYRTAAGSAPWRLFRRLHSDKDGNAYYKNNNGKYELTDTFDPKMEFQDGVTVTIYLSSEKKVESVMVLDSYVAMVRRLDG